MAVKVVRRVLNFMMWLSVLIFGASLTIVLVLVVIAVRDSGFSEDTKRSSTDHAVAVVPLTGEILSSEKFRERLQRATDNEDMKAIVVRIDSPGGAVGASEEIYRAIKMARETKPVVCALGNTAASGGLYAAMGCQKIVTNRGTITGSIGVILMMPNFTKIIDKFGMQMNVVKSGQFKDTGSPFRAPTNDDTALLQSLVNQTYEQFVQTIAEARGIEVGEVKKFADGRIIVGDDAVKLGIADEIGDVRRAGKVALELAGDSSEPELVYQRSERGFWGMFTDLEDAEAISWVRSVAQIGRLRFLYQAFR